MYYVKVGNGVRIQRWCSYYCRAVGPALLDAKVEGALSSTEDAMFMRGAEEAANLLLRCRVKEWFVNDRGREGRR